MSHEDKVEGYWANQFHPEYPMPVAQDEPWEGQAKFLEALSALEGNAKVLHYKGFSHCRVCECINGSREYEHGGWRWPAGFRHYIEAHNVEPTPEFRAFIEAESPPLHHQKPEDLMSQTRFQLSQAATDGKNQFVDMMEFVSKMGASPSFFSLDAFTDIIDYSKLREASLGAAFAQFGALSEDDQRKAVDGDLETEQPELRQLVEGIARWRQR